MVEQVDETERLAHLGRLLARGDAPIQVRFINTPPVKAVGAVQENKESINSNTAPARETSGATAVPSIADASNTDPTAGAEFTENTANASKDASGWNNKRPAAQDGNDTRGGKKRHRGQYKNKERKQMAKDQRQDHPRLQTICLNKAFWNFCEMEQAGTCKKNHDVQAKLAEIRDMQMPYEVVAATNGSTTNGDTAEADSIKIMTSTPASTSPDSLLTRTLSTIKKNTECLAFRAHGFCPAGINCLWAADHVDMETGENIFDWVKISENSPVGSTDSTASCSPTAAHQHDRDFLKDFIRQKLLCTSLASGIAEINQLTDEQKNGLRRRRLSFGKAEAAMKLFNKLGKDGTVEQVEGGGGGAETSGPTSSTEEQVLSTIEDTSTSTTIINAVAAASEDPGVEPKLEQDSSSANPDPSTSSLLVGASLETNDRTHDMPALREQKKQKLFCAKRILAPLTTVGNLPFRRLCVDEGCEVTVSEMALAESVLNGQASELAMLRRHASEKLFGVQITSGSAGAMTKCAQFLNDHCDVDFVDINAACPLDQLHTKGCGSILTVREKALRQMIFGMKSVLSADKFLTCKIRISHYDDCSRYDALQLLPKLHLWGADAAILHGRTARQRYTKLANWDYLKKCHTRLAEIPSTSTTSSAANGCAPGLPLIGCGDVMSYTQYNKYLDENYVDSVMIGRGALIKPWVFREIAEQRHIDLSATERLDMIKKYCQYGLEHWGSDERGRDTTRRFLLEWLSFFHRYIPIGMLEREHYGETVINWRPPRGAFGRDDLETLLMSPKCEDWIHISELFLGKCGPSFSFVPKHKSASYKDENTNAG
ncbi:unnamed protein product [Amoebophrya sp. A25]|nr:unnamed protein product [Amoebophrya sp. A25]|eukprot:GSA25T00024871001.1